MGIIPADLIRRAEQKSVLAGLDHSQIIEAVANPDRLKTDRLKCLDCRVLGVLDTHLVADDLALGRNDQRIAEQSRPAQLLHQGLGKLRECITDDDCLRHAAQFVQKFDSARQGIDLGNSLLDLRKSKSVFFQYSPSEGHELVIIRLIAGRSPQFRNTRDLRKSDPDLRYQYSFQV